MNRLNKKRDDTKRLSKDQVKKVKLSESSKLYIDMTKNRNYSLCNTSVVQSSKIGGSLHTFQNQRESLDVRQKRIKNDINTSGMIRH